MLAKFKCTPRFLDNSVYATLGILHFQVCVGYEKLFPKNVEWLTFRDQLTHWLGWRFFAESEWIWPPGANFRYGWESSTSIIASDSWPLLALLFKSFSIPQYDTGQYFGLGYLLGSVALVLGCSRLLKGFGLNGVERLASVTIVCTLPMFWFMHRWYPALSGGSAILVWTFILYFEDARAEKVSIPRWSLLLMIGLATQFYLFAIAAFIYLAAVIKCWRKSYWRSSLFGNTSLTVLILAEMYLLGYFLIPLTRASTGDGYGEFSANLLALVDPAGSSRLIVDLPSTEQQYEPAFVGLGALILALTLLARSSSGVKMAIAQFILRHRIFCLAVVLMSFFAVSNVITIGRAEFRIPLPLEVIKISSIFRSSVRFIWPLTLLFVVGVVVWASRHLRKPAVVLSIAAFLQLLDVSSPIRAVSQRPNGQSVNVAYAADLWESAPSTYTAIAQHPAGNYKSGWAECAIAALYTNRRAECAYLARVIRLDEITEKRELKFREERPPVDVVWWFDEEWFTRHFQLIQERYDRHEFAFVYLPTGILMFSGCNALDNCAFLGTRRQSVHEIMLIINGE